MKQKIMLGLSSLLLTTSALAEINISGFASVVGGQVLEGSGIAEYGLDPTFLADYPSVGAYNEDKISYVNTAFNRLAGYKTDTILKKAIRILFIPSDLQSLFAHWYS